MKRPIPGFRRTKAQRRRHFIKEWREFRGLSQERVADELETTKATISRIETGDLPYSQDFLESVAELLAVHMAALLSRPPADADRLPGAGGPDAPRPGARRR